MSTVHITAVVVLTNNPVRTILYFLAIHLVFSVPFKPLFRRIFLLKSWVLLVLIFYPSYIIYIIFPQCCCCGYRPPSHCHTQEYISGGGQPLDCGLLISSLLRREFKKGSRRGDSDSNCDTAAATATATVTATRIAAHFARQQNRRVISSMIPTLELH